MQLEARCAVDEDEVVIIPDMVEGLAQPHLAAVLPCQHHHCFADVVARDNAQPTPASFTAYFANRLTQQDVRQREVVGGNLVEQDPRAVPLVRPGVRFLRRSFAPVREALKGCNVLKTENAQQIPRWPRMVADPLGSRLLGSDSRRLGARGG